MKYRPYVSIDIETTGLNREKSYVLEIGAVFDDLISPLSDLKTFNAKISYPHIEYAEFGALSINRNLIFELSKPLKHEHVMPFIDAISEFLVFLKNCQDKVREYESTRTRKYDDVQIHVAGKNPSSFDIPIIRNQIMARLQSPLNEEYVQELDEIIHYRFIDAGSLFLSDFDGYIPTLTDINAMIGRQKTSHKAVDDAYDVVCAVRHKLGVPF